MCFYLFWFCFFIITIILTIILSIILSVFRSIIRSAIFSIIRPLIRGSLKKKSKKVRFLRLNARFHTTCATPIDRIGLLVATAQNFAQKERNALQTNALRTFLLSISTHRGP